MIAPVKRGLRFRDFDDFPDDNVRREIVGGDLYVAPTPLVRHQSAVVELGVRLAAYGQQRGGRALLGPLPVLLTDQDVVSPDVLYLAPDHASNVEEWGVHGAPDVVVEVLSPATLHFELVRKRELYERHAVPECWYVDLDADRLEVYRLDEQGRYPTPTLLSRGDTLTSAQLPGWEAPVDDIIGPPDR